MIDSIRNQLETALGSDIRVSIQVTRFTPSLEIRIIPLDSNTEIKLNNFDLHNIKV